MLNAGLQSIVEHEIARATNCGCECAKCSGGFEDLKAAVRRRSRRDRTAGEGSFDADLRRTRVAPVKWR
jgi:hypothetical protein